MALVSSAAVVRSCSKSAVRRPMRSATTSRASATSTSAFLTTKTVMSVASRPRSDRSVDRSLRESGGLGFEQVPAAVEPASQQPLFLAQLRHLSRVLVDVGVQVIEAVAGQRIHPKDLLERQRPLMLAGQLRHLFLDSIKLASHVGGDVAQRLQVDPLRLFDDHRRTPTVKSGALRSGNRAASAGEIATLFE